MLSHQHPEMMPGPNPMILLKQLLGNRLDSPIHMPVV
ncbi:hypothetical protein GcM1_034001 [Golovinomyces cichoracearum]|uniref:Uncharacterized protein n=1 Tax=Golovinomyces cichoracearum TaxID=62708 RepID=A0A420JCG0_9PEZI|nr:hypothetical protein GcM1_034001 [Golovinomyces cichoracearum]